MSRTRLKVKLTDDAVTAYFTKHPDEEFWILTGHPSENGLSLLLVTETADVAAVIQYFTDTPEVTSYEVLYVDNQGVLIELSVPESAPLLWRRLLVS